MSRAITHVVLLRWSERADQGVRASVRATVRAMAGTISDITELREGTSFSPSASRAVPS